MHEVCFCGREGELEARKPVRAIDGSWQLCCPRCNRLDDLAWMTPETREQLWRTVWTRQLYAHLIDRAPVAEKCA